MKEYECVQVNHHKEVAKKIQDDVSGHSRESVKAVQVLLEVES